MSLVFSEEEQLLRASVQEFCAKEVAPVLAEETMRTTQTGEPMKLGLGLWHRMGELGFIGLSTSEEMGGTNMGLAADLIVEEELAAGGAFALATNLDAHNLTLRALEFNGSDYQKQKWGVPGATGEIMLAAAISDPAGSMNFPEWNISCVEDGDELVINGTKNFCTNSRGADAYAIAVKDYDRGYPMTFVMVDAGTPGLEFGELEFVGRSGTNTGTIYLNDVRVPKENRMPAADFGNAAWLALGYLDCAIAVNGLSRIALNIAEEYVKGRSRNGRPLAALQSVAHRIVNMETKWNEVRALTYAAAELWDNGTPDLKLHSMAKILAAEYCTDITKECVTLLGTYGMAPGSGVYEAYTFAPAGWLGECPNDFHRDLIAQLIGMPQDSWLNNPVG